jgi:hypothetical protein
MASDVAAPAVTEMAWVALVSPEAVNVSVYVPVAAVRPKSVNVAVPLEAVAVLLPTSVPPVETATVITVEESVVTTLPELSTTLTCGWVVNAAPDAAPAPARATVNPDAAPGIPVAVNITGEPDKEPDVAVSVLEPAVVPRVQAGEVATPELFVVTTPEDASDPPPVATAKVTLTPETGLPAVSVTWTAGLVVTAVPTVAD